MNNNWFTVKVKYTKQLDNGTFKRVTEPYLLAAMSFTDAEARIYEELGNIIRGEFSVMSITRTDISDIFSDDEADTWYKVKVEYAANSEGENSKKIALTVLQAAVSVKDAVERIKENFSTLLVDFTIPKVEVSPIVDIFPFKSDDNDHINLESDEEG